jgi:DNA-binding NtrC family response regulator
MGPGRRKQNMSATRAALVRTAEERVLVVSSQEKTRHRLLRDLPAGSDRPAQATGGADALMQLEAESFGTLLLDPGIEDLDVEELTATIRKRYPQLRVVLLDAQCSAAALGRAELQEFGAPGRCAGAAGKESGDEIAEGSAAAEETAEGAAEDVSGGAGDEVGEAAGRNIGEISERARGLRALSEMPLETEGARRILLSANGERAGLTREASARAEDFPGMIGSSVKMRQLYRLARLVAPRDTTVLVVGETGTGKELIARGIHGLSRRSRGPFIVVNCAAIPESLLEAELFGFTRGAFTGAFQSRLGRIHAAHGGTLLLDEVGELPPSMQAKLLRFVQEGEVQRLGSSDVFRVDARLVAATNADLLQRVREKQFREDLYYRLAVFPLELPPLRHRLDDILPLAQHFLAALCRSAGVAPKAFSAAALSLLRQHAWPGNVRELQHGVERAFVLAEEKRLIDPEDLALPGVAA